MRVPTPCATRPHPHLRQSETFYAPRFEDEDDNEIVTLDMDQAAMQVRAASLRALRTAVRSPAHARPRPAAFPPPSPPIFIPTVRWRLRAGACTTTNLSSLSLPLRCLRPPAFTPLLECMHASRACSHFLARAHTCSPHLALSRFTRTRAPQQRTSRPHARTSRPARTCRRASQRCPARLTASTTRTSSRSRTESTRSPCRRYALPLSVACLAGMACCRACAAPNERLSRWSWPCVRARRLPARASAHGSDTPPSDPCARSQTAIARAARRLHLHARRAASAPSRPHRTTRARTSRSPTTALTLQTVLSTRFGSCLKRAVTRMCAPLHSAALRK